MAAALAVAALGALAGQAVARAVMAEQPRCYWIGPPLTQLKPMLLKRGVLDCSLSQCQFTVRETREAGWVCFFARPGAQ